MMFRQIISEKVLPGVYVCKENGRGIIVDEDGKYYCGTLKIKGGVYVYFQYRRGKKVIQKYLGKKALASWIKHGEYII